MLFIIDFVCGGVTSPELWNKYLKFKTSKNEISSISMRNKSMGYLNENGFPAFSMEINYTDRSSEVVLRPDDLFLNTRFSFYRSSCYSCVFKGVAHASDITLGDFCGLNFIDRSWNSKNGVTLVIPQNEKGRQLIKSCGDTIESRRYDIETAIKYNPMVTVSMRKSAYAEYLRESIKTSSVEKLFYETKIFEIFSEKEQIKRDLWIERLRNELYLKTMLFKEYKLSLNDVPGMRENIAIYGSGKIGKVLAQCENSKISFFIDGNPQIKSYNGKRVYKLSSKELDDILVSDAKRTTVVVTPVWDKWSIKDELIRKFPELDVISLEEVVEKIYVL